MRRGISFNSFDFFDDLYKSNSPKKIKNHVEDVKDTKDVEDNIFNNNKVLLLAYGVAFLIMLIEYYICTNILYA
jgi:hypothetical protein